MRDAIILAGSGRSGTTWLGNILAANPNVRVLFEPFDSRRVPEAAALPLRPYARPGERYPQWELLVRRILMGEVQNAWINRQGNRWWASTRLVKAIRINLMLGWMSEAFRPRIVFITRHPCAVVLSRLKLGWDTHLDVFLSQPHLVADYLEPFVELILAAETAVQRHAVMWCIENLVPLRQLPHYDWVFCTYEELCCWPEAEAERILGQLDIRKSWFTRRAMGRVSGVARSDSAVVADRNPVLDWQYKLPEKDINTVLETVAAFGIDLYGADAMPCSDSLKPVGLT